MIYFHEINRENFNSVIQMEVYEGQKGFMEDNLYSIAECAFEKEFVAKAIYSNDEPVGFMLYYFVEDEPNYVFLHRFMIDRNKQGRGLGKAALEGAVALFASEFPTAECVELMHYPDNIIGATLYDRMGFVPTGEHRNSEPCRCENGTDDENRKYEIVRRLYYK